MYHVVPVASYWFRPRQESGLPICQRPVRLASQRRARIFSVLRVEHGGRDVAAVMADWRSPPVPAPQTVRRARSAGPTRAETPSPFTGDRAAARRM